MEKYRWGERRVIPLTGLTRVSDYKNNIHIQQSKLGRLPAWEYFVSCSVDSLYIFERKLHHCIFYSKIL